jgi:flagellar secretion chaperone FliS
MTQRNKPWESYRKVATQTATPGQLVLMLYDGAIGFLEKALTGFGYTDPLAFNQTVNNNILRAQAIIHEMNASLNMEAGGEVSANLRRLYNYLYRRLRDANRRKQREPIDETIGRLRVLRDSWAEMLRQGGESRPANASNALEAAAA